MLRLLALLSIKTAVLLKYLTALIFKMFEVILIH